MSGEKTMLTLLYAALFLSVGAGLFTQKKYGKSVSSAADLSMYSMITGIIACIFFWCSGGFVLAYNMRTVLYSAVYAVVVLASQFLLLVLYKRSGIAKTTVISSSAALFMTWGLGLLLFSEKFSAVSAFRCLLMIAAGVLIARPEMADSAAKSAPKAAGLRNMLMAALLGLTETCAALLSKFFAADERKGLVTDSNSLFFMVNLILIGFNILLLSALERGNLRNTVEKLRKFSLKQTALIIGSTVSSNVTSLLGVRILALGSMSLYAPMNSALKLIAGFAVGRIFFREKPGILPAVLATASVLLGFIH